MEKFCEDIGVEPENVINLPIYHTDLLLNFLTQRSVFVIHWTNNICLKLQIVMLALAWKLEAKQMGFFTLAEWLKGMSDLQ